MLSAIAVCPGCGGTLQWLTSVVSCRNCSQSFPRIGDYVDFLSGIEPDDTVATALDTWGGDLHAAPASVTPHYTQLQALFATQWAEKLRGKVLEIGCGSGSDTLALAADAGVETLYSFDIGRNVEALARLSTGTKIHLFRASALAVPIRDCVIDTAYSFGVFHHTTNPPQCMAEASRVLKPGGSLFVYLYGAHESAWLKRLGVEAERILMAFMRKLPRRWREACCVILSPPMWALFSLPARVLTACGFAALARSLPMHWGSGPFSLVPDLKDRLLAPVNHRYTRAGLDRTLRESGFQHVEVRATPSGLYAYCEKAAAPSGVRV